MPLNIVLPPAKTIFLNKSFLISLSHLIMQSWRYLWIPSSFFPNKRGLNISSGHWILSLFSSIVSPPGNAYFSEILLCSVAYLSSASKSWVTKHIFSLIILTYSKSVGWSPIWPSALSWSMECKYWVKSLPANGIVYMAKGIAYPS